jgi:hypothetical protein
MMTLVVPNRTKVMICAIALAGMCSFSMQTQASTLYSYGGVGFGNDCIVGTCSQVVSTGNQSETTNGTVADSGSASLTVNGLDVNGTSGQSILTGQATALTSYTALKTYATAGISNPLFNDVNAVYSIGDGTVNTGGVADVVDSLAIAYAADSLNVGNTNVAYVKLNLSFDGSIAGTGGRTFLTLDEGKGAFTAQNENTLWYLYWEDTWSFQTLTSVAIPVVNGVAKYGLKLYSEVLLNAAYLSAGDTHIGTADFYNTVTIDSISGFNSLGEQISLGTLSSESGTSYVSANVPPTDGGGNTVPEPETLALSVLGLAILRLYRRKSNPN